MLQVLGTARSIQVCTRLVEILIVVTVVNTRDAQSASDWKGLSKSTIKMTILSFFKWETEAQGDLSASSDPLVSAR